MIKTFIFSHPIKNMVQETEHIIASDSSQTIIQRPVFNEKVTIESSVNDTRTIVSIVERPSETRRESQPKVVTSSIKKVKKYESQFTKEDSIKFTLSNNSTAGADWDVTFSVKDKIRKTSISEVDSSAIKRREGEIINIAQDKSSEKKSKTNNLSTTKIVNQKEEIKVNELGFDTSSIFFLVLFPVIILGYVKIYASKYIKDTFSGFLFLSMTNEANSATNLSNRAPSYLLLLLFYLNSSIFIYESSVILPIANFKQHGLFLVLFSVLFLIAFVFVKHFVMFLLGHIFNLQEAVKLYILQIEIIYRVFAIISLPFIVFIPFSSPIFALILIKTLIIIFCFLYLVQMLRIIKDNFTSIFSLYYIILYLCALEIAPLILIYKVMFK